MAQTELIRGHGDSLPLQPPLLATKFYIPPTRPQLVLRSELIEQVNEGVQGQLTLICAPAGFGKTSLLSQWCSWRARQSQLPVAWVSLDASDNDPVQFWSYVITALRRLYSEMGEDTLLLLHSPQPPPIELILTTLLNALMAVAEEVALVLDDYHLITVPAIHQALTYLLEHLPPHIHLLLASRSDPPLPLARLRSRGQLTELRTDTLRFSVEEAEAFLHRVTGHSFTPETVAALAERTEGWIAGLQLAALSLKGRTDSSDFLQTFVGSHRYILDYLSDEVLHRQPEVLQTFLLQTSILDRLNGPLCDAVTGQHTSQALLEQIERDNLFLVSLDDERGWYRYHHLFDQVLRHRLRHSSPELIPKLHQRAADWYEQQGLLSEAVGHALATADYTRAVRLIEQATTWMLYGERSTLQQWLEALPQEQLKDSARLCIAYAVLLAANLHFEAVEPYLHLAEVALQETPQGETVAQMHQLFGEIDSLRADLACHRGDLSSAIALCRQALERIPKEQVFLRGTIYMTLGLSYCYNHEIAAAQQALSQALELSQAADNLYNVLHALYMMAETQAMRGQFRQAYRTYQRVLHVVELHPEYGRSRHVGLTYIMMGQILYEWNQLTDAEQLLHKGIEHAQQNGVDAAILIGDMFLAHVRQAQGAVDEARTLMQHIEQIIERGNVPRVITNDFFLHLVRLWTAQGKLDAAMQLEQRSRRLLECEDSLPSIHGAHCIILARVLLAQSRQEGSLPTERSLEEALRLTEEVRSQAEVDGHIEYVLETLVLQALIQHAQGQLPQALTALHKTLSLTEPEGYVRLFVNEGPPMAELLQQLAASGQASPYIARLLEALGISSDRQQEVALPQSGVQSAVVEPLSEREVEVLRLIATGRSNAEIAQVLVVSTGTVHTHLKHIYGKLDVHNRTEAVAHARELDLLAS
jgi:LuxR family transcriptional regulator, maltose regulon positive regulatory protein